MIIEIILCILMIITSILAIKLKDNIHAILALAFMTLLVGLLYLKLGAFYVGVFQLSIYTATMTMIFLVAEYITRHQRVGSMRYNKCYMAIAIVVTLIILVSFSYLIITSTFPKNKGCSEPVSEALWEDFLIPLLIQAFLIFATIIAILSLVRERVMR